MVVCLYLLNSSVNALYRFAAAEFDCTTSISLDPLYVKAYLRRATSRAALGKMADAVNDFNRVLDLEPTNKQAKGEIERINKVSYRIVL